VAPFTFPEIDLLTRRNRLRGLWSLVGLLITLMASAHGEDSPGGISIEPQLVHLRNKPEREWSDFPESAASSRLNVSFNTSKNNTEYGLFCRQQDVKQSWHVVLNGKRLGELVRDENDMTTGFSVPAGLLADGPNTLAIESPAATTPTDDIRVGAIRLHARPLSDLLGESTLEVSILDGESRQPLPGRLTIVDAQGSLIALGTSSNEELAIRPGTVYTANGHATVKLPAGRYTVFAGRGFEYSLAQTEFTVKPGEHHRQTLTIRREVSTPGYVACDPHVHTLSFSGHGDATIAERMITLAGEGIELPIATDHNQYVDYEPFAKKSGLRRHFTPVIGNEVTTPRGHFNIFPVLETSRVPDAKQTDWRLLFDDIARVPGVKIAILNHARDLHSGVRPFGPEFYNSVAAVNLEGWPLRFQGMEVVNSGATQTDVLQLFHDWMGLLNRGYQVTPVGSSDSHDVARHFVGQGRTYVRCDDRDPGNLDVDRATQSFLQGQVMVSYGLLTSITVNEKYSSGELASAPEDELQVKLTVSGPGWVQANRIMLFANGVLLREEQIEDPPNKKPLDGSSANGIKWAGHWKIPRPRHDVHLVAIAMGPGIRGLYWRTARPYQPTSLDPSTRVIGCSGAVWVDADGDGRRMSAYDYAVQLRATEDQDLNKLMTRLTGFDEATAAQMAHLLQQSGIPLQEDRFQSSLKNASPSVQAGFRRYHAAVRENEMASAKTKTPTP
jgi:hypothetical protein